jgi:hypothetical protein
LINLQGYKKNVFSQDGEDGIIEKLCEMIGLKQGVCVEFGAWDGFKLSNTANLWTRGWKGILIECDKEKFKVLQENTKKYNTLNLNLKVGTNGNSIDNILKIYNIDKIDLLSIDVDNDDIHIFRSLKDYSPSIVLCEYNPTIPPHIKLEGKMGERIGCSALSLCECAGAIGYKVVAITSTNVIFCKEKICNTYHIPSPDLQNIFDYSKLCYLISDYDGGSFLSRKPIYGMRGKSKYRRDYDI